MADDQIREQKSEREKEREKVCWECIVKMRQMNERKSIKGRRWNIKWENISRWCSHQRQWTFGIYTYTKLLLNWIEKLEQEIKSVCVCVCEFECNGNFCWLYDFLECNEQSVEWRMVFWHHAWVYCHHHETRKIFLIKISKYLHKFMYSLAVMSSIGRCWCLKSI